MKLMKLLLGDSQTSGVTPPLFLDQVAIGGKVHGTLHNQDVPTARIVTTIHLELMESRKNVHVTNPLMKPD